MSCYDQACDSVRAEMEKEILVAGRRLVSKCVAKVPSKKVKLAKYVVSLALMLVSQCTIVHVLLNK